MSEMQPHDGERQPHDGASEIPENFVKGVPETPAAAQADCTGGQAAEPALDERLQALAEEANIARDQALRAQAELDNFRKRTQREQGEERKYAALAVVRDLLPGLDNLQRAIEAGRNTHDASNLLQGVEMVAGQLAEILTRHGATPIPAVGQPFDPNRHEAIQQLPSAEHPPMTVLDEVERGYTLHDRVIRPSKVIVSVIPPGEGQPQS